MHQICSGSVSIEKASIAAIQPAAYTGKAIRPEPSVSLKGTLLKKGRDYTLSYKTNRNAGQAAVIIRGIGNYKGSVNTGFTIKKTDQSLRVKMAKTKTVGSGKLKKAKRIISKAIIVKNAKGKVFYKKVSGSKKLSVNKKTGKITVKKKTGKGRYTIKIRVTAAGDTNYSAAEKIVKVTVKVK